MRGVGYVLHAYTEDVIEFGKGKFLTDLKSSWFWKSHAVPWHTTFLPSCGLSKSDSSQKLFDAFSIPRDRKKSSAARNNSSPLKYYAWRETRGWGYISRRRKNLIECISYILSSYTFSSSKQEWRCLATEWENPKVSIEINFPQIRPSVLSARYTPHTPGFEWLFLFLQKKLGHV